MDVVTIRKVREPYGLLGNMSPHPVEVDGNLWHTTEALFQAMRFAEEDPIREEIRGEKNPMKAKFKAKGNADRMVVEQMSQRDLNNMWYVLRLKLNQHDEVRETLLSTSDLLIVEDCTNRQRGSGLFWGAALQEDGTWKGDNWLGRLWMRLREYAAREDA